MLINLSKKITQIGPNGGTITEADMIAAAGYDSFLLSPNVVWVRGAFNWTSFTLTDMPVEFPNGYIRIPSGTTVKIDGQVSHPLPIVWENATALMGINGPLADQFTYTGPIGNGPTSKEDAAHIFELSSVIMMGVFIQSSTLNVTGIIIDNGIFLPTETIYAFTKPFAFYGSCVLRSNGESFIAASTVPIDFNDILAATTMELSIDGFINGAGGFLGTTGDLWDFTGLDPADPGNTSLKIISNESNMGNVAWSTFVFTDDDTISSGNISSNVLDESSLGDLLSGIDHTSVNTTLTGNTGPGVRNTQVNGATEMVGNLIVTLNPGILLTPILIAGVSVLGIDVTRFDDDSGANNTLRYIGKGDETFMHSWGGSVRRATGGGLIEINLMIFIGGVFRALLPMDVNGSLVPLPNLPANLNVATNDVVTFEVEWVDSTTVDLVFSSLYTNERT